MAVTRLWKVTDRLDRVIDYAEDEEKTRKPKFSDTEWQSLKDVLEYAKDEEKTEQQYFVTGINCNADKARDQFVAVKQQYNKTEKACQTTAHRQKARRPRTSISCAKAPFRLY